MSQTNDETGSLETLSQAIRRLQHDGFVENWRAVDGELVCGQCGHSHAPDSLTIDEVVRFEGDSNPDDSSILFALSADCDHRGLYSVAYSVDISPEDVAVVQALGS